MAITQQETLNPPPEIARYVAALSPEKFTAAKSNRIGLVEEAMNSETMLNAPLIGVGEALSALREMSRVAAIARDIGELQGYIGKFINHPVLGPRFKKLKNGPHWNDLGELKGAVRDQLAVVRAEVAKRGLETVEARRD